MNETERIAAFCKAWKQCGATVLPSMGEDCATLPAIPRGHISLLKTDAIVEGVHFTPQTAPSLIGRKAIARVLSDFAASGGHPICVMVSLGVPQSLPMARLKALYCGMGQMAHRFHVSLAGGETVRSVQLWINITCFGSAPRNLHLTRSGAKPGDFIYCTGNLGGSFPRRHLTFDPRLPQGQWLAQKRLATAAMDLSDGLGADLPKLAAASSTSYRIHPQWIPRTKGVSLHQAINDGEDYELLFTVRPSKEKLLLQTWPFPLPISRIGTLLKPTEKPDTGGLPFFGFDHFAT